MSKEIRMTLQLVELSDTSKRSTYHSSVIVGEALDAVDYDELVRNVVRFAGMLTAEDFIALISGQSEEKKR